MNDEYGMKNNGIDERLILSPMIRERLVRNDELPENTFVFGEIKIIRIVFTSFYEAYGISMSIVFEMGFKAKVLYFKNFSHIDWSPVHYLNSEFKEKILENAKMFITFSENEKLKVDVCSGTDEENNDPIISFHCDKIVDMSIEKGREILDGKEGK